jgi:hypothetical protein
MFTKLVFNSNISINHSIEKQTNSLIMKWNKIPNAMLLALIGLTILISSCNKDLEQFSETIAPQGTGLTLDKVLQSNADDSLYYQLVVRGGQLELLKDSSKSHTIFATNNQGIKPVLSAIAAQAGITLPANAPDVYFSGFIAQMPAELAGLLVQASIVPQSLKSTDINSSTPNYVYPTILNPVPFS